MCYQPQSYYLLRKLLQNAPNTDAFEEGVSHKLKSKFLSVKMKIGNFFAFKQTGIPLGFSVGIGVSVLISYSLRYGKPERNPHGLLFIFLNVSDNVQCNAFLGGKISSNCM